MRTEFYYRHSRPSSQDLSARLSQNGQKAYIRFNGPPFGSAVHFQANTGQNGCVWPSNLVMWEEEK